MSLSLIAEYAAPHDGEWTGFPRRAFRHPFRKWPAVWLSLIVPLLGARALDWQTGAGFRSAALNVPATGRAGFTLLNEAQTHITFTNHLSDTHVAENQIRLIGSGVALGDMDGDGWCDVYLCGLDGSNALYRNLGHWQFADITAAAGVACAGQLSTGCALADVDGDGDLDLLVNSISGGTRLFLNDGKGRFTESANSGLLRKYCATTLALADVDGDGDLDLYVANYRTTTIRSDGLKVLNVNGKRVLRPEDREAYEFTKDGLLLEHGEPDQLYLNDGKGHFAPLPWTDGAFLDEDGKPLATAPRDWGLSAMFRDINGDGTPDLYVCNDFWSVDRVWLNESREGRTRFSAAPRLMLRETSTFSMGVDFADFNRDGFDEFIVLDMLSRDHPRRLRQHSAMGQGTTDSTKIEDRPQVERNTLFLNRGDGTFAEIAQLAGVQASEWSWGVVCLDVDLDGYEDMLITTGHGFDTQDADTDERLARRGPVPNEKLGERVLQYPRLKVPNTAFRNRGDLTFEECAAKWGFDTVGISHGIALADLDNDGDLDMVVNNLNGPVGLYRNESTAPRVAVRLAGKAPNTRGIGAKVRFADAKLPQSQEIISGGRYLSCDEAARVFAAPTGASRLEVTWRHGTVSVVSDVQPNHLYEINEAAASRLPPPASRTTPPPLFREVTDFHHTHHDEPFDDFARQPLLPRKLSQLGPGVAWIDIDGDGREDLCIGSGRGGALGIFRNRGDGGFDAMRVGGVLGQAPDDQTAMVGWSPAPGVTTLLVGQANYESAPSLAPSDGERAGVRGTPAAHHVEIAGGLMKMMEPLPGAPSSTGPLALADIDGDGDLDLFIGGRVVPGRYPEPASSRLFRNDDGKFTLATEWKNLGQVSGAIFSDLDGDGLPELILACEWGPLKIFRTDHGKLMAWHPPVQLHTSHLAPLTSLRGWWTGVAAGDFDGDGRLDLVAGNWGRNLPWQSFQQEDWSIFYGDFAERGGVELIEAFFDVSHRRLAPWRDLDALAPAMPWLRERFATHAAFAEADVSQIFVRPGSAKIGIPYNGQGIPWTKLSVNWTESTLFLNRGDHFEVRLLPLEAQFAPAFGLCVGDADGDGLEDLFLAQNFFDVDEKTSRYDAGRGLWLRGDGQGGFRALAGPENGVMLYGEQRGAALCDYDGDGRVDLAVSQNNAATKLFHNEQARPGLRVRLAGPPGNANGIGAVLRMTTARGAGPAREIHAGAGYWSQDSTVMVLRAPEPGTKLSVRWPGGKMTVCAVPKEALEIMVDTSGGVKVLRSRQP